MHGTKKILFCVYRYQVNWMNLIDKSSMLPKMFRLTLMLSCLCLKPISGQWGTFYLCFYVLDYLRSYRYNAHAQMSEISPLLPCPPFTERVTSRKPQLYVLGQMYSPPYLRTYILNGYSLTEMSAFIRIYNSWSFDHIGVYLKEHKPELCFIL